MEAAAHRREPSLAPALRWRYSRRQTRDIVRLVVALRDLTARSPWT